MTWARLDDSFPEHPKVIGLSDAAFRLHVVALCYCARNMTDGAISSAAGRFMGAKAKIVRELVDGRLWDVAEDGWIIHDYLAYNPSRERTLSRRASATAAGMVRANQRWDSETLPERLANRSPNTHAGKHAPGPKPVPARPLTLSPPSEEQLPAAAAEVLGSIRLTLSERVWREDPSIEAEIRALIDAHGPDVISAAVRECYLHKSNGRTMRPYPGNIRLFLPGTEVGNGKSQGGSQQGGNWLANLIGADAIAGRTPPVAG